VVRLTYPTTEVDRRVRDTWLTLAAVAGISLLAASLIGVALARWIAAPLRRVQEGATALGDGDLATRVPERSGPPEVRALAAAFNETARRLEELIEAQDAFVADASHQLRTPLTALRLRLENLESEGGDDGADVLAALDEVRRLARMVDGLLALARAERHAAGSLAVPVAVTAALDERRDAWAPVGDERAVTIAVEGAADLSVLVEPGRFAQVVDNLLDNALEASPPGTTVVLRAVEDGDRVEVHVEDQGPGMNDEQRARAFDRFWQGAEGTGSSGLGLAIVSKLVHADGGAVDLRPVASGGLDAVVVLPRAPA
jgi:signal transduction histidine kinase